MEGEVVEAGESSREVSLASYVPRLAIEWDLDAPNEDWRTFAGTLCFVDISGFTALSERLAARGRIGSEALTDILSAIFGEMLALAYERDGMLIKFGGDALLLLFTGDDHARQACTGAMEMRRALRDATKRTTSAGRLRLRMSVGISSGEFFALRVGEDHQEFVLCGPAATTTVLMEQTADANEVVVSAETASLIPPKMVGERKGPGFLLKDRRMALAAPGPTHMRPVPLEQIVAWIPSQLRRGLLAGVESEHKNAAIAFLRVEGTDDVLANEGPGVLRRLLDQIMRDVQVATRAEGITILATDADTNGVKIILTSGVPDALEDEAGRALRAVRRILDSNPPLPVRGGVNFGHVFAGDVGTRLRRTYTVMGDAVNLAARLMAAASPGEVYVSADVLERSRTVFETRALEPLRLKGKAAPVQAYSLGAETGRRRDLEASQLPFTGREAELRTLQSRLDEAGGGSGSVVEIGGEAGVGKTRLVEEFLRRNTTAVFQLAGEPYGVAAPYRALREPLRQLLGIVPGSDAGPHQLVSGIARLAPDLVPLAPLVAAVVDLPMAETEATEAIEPRFRRELAARTVVRLVGAEYAGRTVVIVEDWHWVDPASAYVVERLAAEARDHPWLLVLLTRTQSEQLPTWIDDRVVLGPLSEREAHALVLAATEAAPLRPHEVRALVERGDGRPLFLEALLQSLRSRSETLPGTLEEVLNAEIDALSPAARRYLRFASVLGNSFAEELAADVFPEECAAIDEEVRRELDRHLVDEGRSRRHFRQAVVRDVAYESLPYRRRRALHARAGEAIERGAGEDVGPALAQLALHFGLARDHAKCWHYAGRAGKRARASYANVEAAAHLERALAAARYLKGISPQELIDLRIELAEVREAAGLFGEAAEALEGASVLPMGVASHAELLRWKARMHERQGNYRAALQCIGRGLRLVEPPHDREERAARAALLSLRGTVRQAQGRPRLALKAAAHAIEEAREANELEAMARACMTLDWAHQQLGQLDRATNLPSALAILEEKGHLSLVASAHLNLGVQAYWAGRWDDAVASYVRGGELFRRAGNEVRAGIAAMNIGELLVGQGRLDEAEPMLIDARRIHLATGLLDAAGFAEQCLGRLYAARRVFSLAKEMLQLAVDRYSRLAAPGSEAEARLYLAQTYCLSGMTEEGAAELERAEQAANPTDGPLAVLHSRVLALVLRGRGEVSRARAVIEHGLGLARNAHLLYEEAELLLLLIDSLDEEADGSGVAAAFADIARRLGLPRPPLGRRLEITYSFSESDADSIG